MLDLPIIEEHSDQSVRVYFNRNNSFFSCYLFNKPVRIIQSWTTLCQTHDCVFYIDDRGVYL